MGLATPNDAVPPSGGSEEGARAPHVVQQSALAEPGDPLWLDDDLADPDYIHNDDGGETP